VTAGLPATIATLPGSDRRTAGDDRQTVGGGMPDPDLPGTVAATRPTGIARIALIEGNAAVL